MQTYPRLWHVNLLYAVTLILVVFVGGVIQLANLPLGLIAVEILFLLVPALLYLRVARLPIRETLRLRWPGWPTILLCLAGGAGVWFLASWLEAVISPLYGYTIGSIPDFFPRTIGGTLLLAAALALSAPIGEEVFFRGVLMRGYERFGPAVAIVASSLLFAFYHVRFQGLLPLIPIAFVLGYVVWRTDSLYAGMAVHFVNNLLAAGYLVLATRQPDLSLPIISAPAALAGLVVAAACLWALQRLHRPPAPATRVGDTRLILALLPLLLAGLVYVFGAVNEVILGRFPQLLAFGQELELAGPPIEAPATLRYEVRNVVDEPVGQAECTLAPAYSVECQVEQEAFEAQTRSSYYNFDATMLQFRAEWAAGEVALASVAGRRESGGRVVSFDVQGDEDGSARMVVTTPDGPAEPVEAEAPAFFEHSWPWRMGGLPFSLGYARTVQLLHPYPTTRGEEELGPRAEAADVVVVGAEPLAVPAGNFVAWKVTLGDQAAWYDVDAPHHLLRYDDGVLSYRLAAAD